MAEAEISLINTVELRIALANSDDKFQSSLNIYLCPLLLKLGSQHSAVRQQILKFIKDLIPRIKAAPNVQLPTSKLIEQGKTPNVPESTPQSLKESVQLYSLLLAAMAVDRLSLQERKHIAVTLCNGISQCDRKALPRLVHILFKCLKGWTTPDRGTPEFEALREELLLSESDERFLVDKFEKLFLLNAVLNNDGIIPRGYTCPGLSAQDVAFLTYDAGVSYKVDQLTETKKNITSVLPLLHDENLVALLYIGSMDSSDPVGNACAALLRKIKIPYEDERLINHIISLYVGDKTLPRSPVKPVIQERFLTILSSSKKATQHPDVPIITSIGLNSTRYPKLKSATIQFLQWVAQNGADSLSSAEYSLNIAAQLRNNLHTDGWPRFQAVQGANFSTQLTQRRLQYEAFGQILKKNGDLLQDLSYIEFLFDSLFGDIAEVRSTIQEALGALMIHLESLPEASKQKLKLILKGFLQDDDLEEDSSAINSVRFTALKYVNATFPFNDPESRMLNVLGTSSQNKSDVIEEAQKGLHPYWFNILQSSNTSEFKPTDELMGVGNIIEFPDFDAMVTELINAVEFAKNRKSASLNHSISTGAEFLLRVLVSQAVKGKATVIVQDQEWGTRLDKGLEFDQIVIESTKNELSNVQMLESFLLLLLNEFTSDGSPLAISASSKTTFGKIFLRLISLSPDYMISRLTSKVSNLYNVIENPKIYKDIIIESAANSIGIIASHPNFMTNEVASLLNNLVFSLQSDLKHSNAIGRLSAAGYLVSRLFYRKRDDAFSIDALVGFYKILVIAMNSTDTGLSDAAITIVGQLAKFGAFGPDISEITNDAQIIEIKGQIVNILKAKCKKINERAIISLSLLSLSEEEPIQEDLTDYESTIYEAHNTKQVESLFTSGEAMAILAAGWDSKLMQQQIDIQVGGLKPRVASRIDRLEFILNKILAACSSTKPTLRKAGCIWLLSLVQYCGHLPQISANSGIIHVTFMRFLADRDELVQDAASRGLSIVYEFGDNDLKETLVKSLLRSFTESTSSSKLSAGTVSEDTELFEPGVLKTHDGSVSTYKDILSLASEVGDPSLVYKFMSMAKNSALWSSRKGIAFGLGSIMSKSSLDKLLFENPSLSNRLIPKLYRYRFDPSSSVSRSMNDIWSSIVSDTAGTVEKYHKAIMKELLTGMGNKEWRVREASTVGLTELVQTLPADKYQEHMEEIWTMAFRAIDDIKESVRKAGGGLTRTLSQILVNSINVDSGSSAGRAKEVLGELLPFLLGNKGIQSDAEEVRDFSLKTILNLVKKAGKAIRPFIGELIEQFILLMSTLEPQIINYLALNADKYKMKSDDIDAHRIQSIGSSPIMNGLERLIDLVNGDIIEEVVDRLQTSVKRSVGLPSKAAASRVLVMLIIRHLQTVKPYGESLLNTCISQLNDRNMTVCSSFATAAGYICRVCSVESVVKYAGKIEKMYFESEDETPKVVAGIASESVSKYSGDRFATVAGAFLPIAFIARHDPSKEVSKTFSSEWSENTSGNGAVKLYIHEICDLVKKYINAQQFQIRQIVAKSIAQACNALDSTTGISNTADLFEVSINACQGRSWNGKEDVLEALVSLSLKSEKYIGEHDGVLPKVKQIVINEAKRRNKTYQKHAIVSLGDFLNKYPDEETYDQSLDIFKDILGKDYYDSDDEDEEELKKNKRNNNKTVNEKSSKKNLTKEADRMKALNSLTKSFQRYNNGSYHAVYLRFILKSLCETLDTKIYIPTWRSQICVVEGLTRVGEVLKDAKLANNTVEELISTWDLLFAYNTKDDDVENVKTQTVRVGKVLLDIGNEKLSSAVKKNLREFQARENNSILQVEIKNALA